MPITSRFASAAARAYGMFRIAAGAVVDPFFNYVTALLHGDGTNGAQNNTFLDSSTNNFTITRNGNTTQGTFSPFSQTGWSNYFDGSANGYLSTPATTDLDLSGDFTLQAWIFLTADSQANGSEILSRGAPTTFNGWHWYYYNNKLNFGFNYAGFLGANNSTLQKNTWLHVAITRSANTFTYYLNGVADGTFTSASTPTTNVGDVVYVGRGSYDTTNRQFPGYMAQVSVIKGTALTTFNTTTPLSTSTSGQSLLTCTANRFLDANTATTAKAITAGSGASVQAFSPFNPTSAWSASSNGGSGYFDGSGDYLTVAANTAFDVSASAYTFETWVYFTTAPSVTIMFGLNGTGTTGYANLLYSGGTLYWQQRGTSTNQTTYTWSPTLGQWYHIAIGWNGSNSLAMWINGTRVATNTVSPTGAGQNGINFGAASDGYAVGGYMSNFRLVKGTDVYGVGNATITVPTAPLTAISNTSFLLNFTNAGIYDNAAVGDYETVGNAQVSTSVVKYGTGSMAFDGTGDWLTAPAQQAFSFGSGDWTVEFWLYTAQTTEALLVANRSGTGATNTNWYIFKAATTNQITLYVSDGSAWQINNLTGGPSVSNSTWYHIAVCRIGSTFKIYVNGTQTATGTWSGAISATLRPLMVGSDYAGATTLNGYIDDLRITKGIARYPYNFTPPTAAFPNIGGTVTLTADPYYNYTTLLLPGNGTNGAQNNTFLDSSSNAFTITRNGNTTQGNFSPFSQTGWGNYFDGSSYIQSSANSALAFSGDFTVETWFYYTGTYTNLTPSILTNSSTGGISAFEIGNGTNYVEISGISATDTVSRTAFTGGAMTPNQWYHLAIVRSSGTIKAYINGTALGTTISNSVATGQIVQVGTGRTAGAGFLFVGYLSNYRMVSSAVYTSNFTPSTTPLTAISGTQMLTCQSNRFYDASSNALTYTTSGSPSVQAFSPFAPTAAWSASTNGGSGYFDGSGDYLNGPATGQFAPTGDFTISMWIYPTSFAASYYVLAGSWNAGAANEWLIQYDNTGAIRFLTTTSSAFSAAGVIKLNQWQFISVSRSGTTLTGYVNGTSFQTYTLTGTVGSATKVVYIGAQQGTTWPYVGWMSDFRLVDGSAQSATPPTAPATAISGTNMLLSCTNGAITDATAKNDLETVGNAQISTTQSKFGGSSMYFDGTGDYLYGKNTRLMDIGSGDFTIEGWLYPTTSGTTRAIVAQFNTNGTGPGWTSYLKTTNVIEFYGGSGTITVTGTGTVSANAWSHFAICRYGSTITIYVNGIAGGTGTNSSFSDDTTGPVEVGARGGAGAIPFTGYIDDLRITKGIARYTSNFTPPTSAFLLQ